MRVEKILLKRKMNEKFRHKSLYKLLRILILMETNKKKSFRKLS